VPLRPPEENRVAAQQPYKCVSHGEYMPASRCNSRSPRSAELPNSNNGRHASRQRTAGSAHKNAHQSYATTRHVTALTYGNATEEAVYREARPAHAARPRVTGARKCARTAG